MAFSINFYLDGAISEKNQEQILSSADAEAKRNLRERIESKQLLILVYLRFPGSPPLKVSMERKCTQKEWDGDKQKVNGRYYKDGVDELNGYLESAYSAISSLHQKNINEGVVTTKADIQEIVDALNNRNSLPRVVITFESAFAEFIKGRSVTHAENTIKKFRTTIKHLRNFSEEMKTPLRFKSINTKFGDDFRQYLLNQGLENNSLVKYIKGLKEFMNFCTYDRDYNSKQNVEYANFEANEVDKEQVYALEMDELMKLYNFEFKSKAQAEVRDVFCFMCFTGLRFSDARKVRRHDILPMGIQFFTKKTRKPYIIPLNKYAWSILKKYENAPNPLPIISNVKTNEHLHEIGKLVGLHRLVRVVSMKGPNIEETYVPFHKVLTTHIGRKTFITNSLIMGMQERALQEIGAPKNPKDFRKYVNFVDRQKHKVMNDIWNDENVTKASK